MDTREIECTLPQKHKWLGYGWSRCGLCRKRAFMHAFVLCIKVGLPAIMTVRYKYLCRPCGRRVRLEILVAKYQRLLQRPVCSIKDLT